MDAVILWIFTYALVALSFMNKGVAGGLNTTVWLFISLCWLPLFLYVSCCLFLARIGVISEANICKLPFLSKIYKNQKAQK